MKIHPVGEYVQSIGVVSRSRHYLARLKRVCAEWRCWGDEYECPICRGIFGQFFPSGLDIPVLSELRVVGGGYRRNAQCPRCGSKERERLVYLFLHQKTRILDVPGRVLHIAPESCLRGLISSRACIEYLCADLHPEDDVLGMDVTDIHFPNNWFDFIICNHVLEHVDDDWKAMAELHRVLKPGGNAILQVPIARTLATTVEDRTVTDHKERERRFGQFDHVRLYGKDYAQRLEAAGFKVRVYNWAEEFGDRLAHRYGLLRDEDLYLCSK